MTEDDVAASARKTSRRTFLAQIGVAGAAAVAAPVIGSGRAWGAATRPGGPTLLGRAARTSPIKHIIVTCQENHAFDHYWGSYKGLPAGFGIPADYTKNSGVKPFHFQNLTGNGDDPNHDWTATHEAYNGGKMNGFVSNGNGRDAMGFYNETDIPYYYSLLPEYALAAEYFCGVLSETLPNRLVLYAGTSGGITSDSAPANGSLTWPCITHLLANHGITYKNYNFHCPNNYSYMALFKGNNNVAKMNQTIADFMSDCKNGTLPQVSFITEAPPYDEHPPANIRTGETMMKSIIKAVKASPVWEHSALWLTYDEGGGFFDHRAPKELDHFGSGIRVPGLMISPLAKKGHVDTTYSDHASVLKFIEHVFGLPTLASINTRFNKSTPADAGQGGGKPFPPRDGNAAISNLTQLFSVAV